MFKLAKNRNFGDIVHWTPSAGYGFPEDGGTLLCTGKHACTTHPWPHQSFVCNKVLLHTILHCYSSRPRYTHMFLSRAALCIFLDPIEKSLLRTVMKVPNCIICTQVRYQYTHHVLLTNYWLLSHRLRDQNYRNGPSSVVSTAKWKLTNVPGI